jgi:GT2 family glycosyltransferase/tetratricopeptide (TPR) repeat protein
MRNERMKINPDVIIGILTWNKKELLQDCLESIFEYTQYQNYRICVYEQASTDGTREYLEGLGDKIDVIYSKKNTGFVHGNNAIMKKYTDSDIVMLNNDTVVTQGWLEALIECAYNSEDTGIVGAKLVYPNGRLQEAGGEIFSDASGRNIGKYDDPKKRQYNVIKEVDYCSGACLYVKRSILNIVKGFDEQFAPAYFEDTDLCFSASKHGFKIMYQPKCTVVHREGATSGVDINFGFKKFQAINKPKFIRKWKKVLEENHRKSHWEVPPDGREKVLIISHLPPMFDMAGGSFRLFEKVRSLSRKYNLAYVSCDTGGKERYVEIMRELDVTVYCGYLGEEVTTTGSPTLDVEAIIRDNEFKAVFIEFYYTANLYVDMIKRVSPRTPVIVDSYDIHFLREEREAVLTSEFELLSALDRNKRMELYAYEKADIVTTVTDDDRQVLLKEIPGQDVRISTHPVSIPEGKPVKEGRDGVVFIGGFTHRPNVDAVLHFYHDIFPLIQNEVPDIKVYIVGNKPPDEILRLQCDNFIITGFVTDTGEYLQKSLVSIAPLRYGAGLKAKVLEAMGAGVPVVTTTIGAEGIGASDNEHVMISDSPEGFAEKVAQLYRDEKLWEKVAGKGKSLVEDIYSFEAVDRAVLEIVDTLPDAANRKTGRFSSDENETTYYSAIGRVAVIIRQGDNLEHLNRCINHIQKNTDNLHEIVVLHRSGETKSREWMEKNFVKYICTSNKGYDSACISRMLASSSEYVAVIDDAVIVTPHWDTGLITHTKRGRPAGAVAAFEPNRRYDTIYELEGMSWEVYRNYKGKYKASVDISRNGCLLISSKALHAVVNDSGKDLDLIIKRMHQEGFETRTAKDVIVYHDKKALKPSAASAKNTQHSTGLSVVITGFSNRVNLRAVIESIQKQDAPVACEDIIVINRRKDQGVEKFLKGTFPSLKIRLTETIQRAVNMAAGQYVLFLQKDVVADRELFKYHLETHRDVTGDLVFIGNTERLEKTDNIILEYIVSPLEKGINVSLSFDPYYASSMSVSRRIAENTGFSKNISYGWQLREFLYRANLDGVPLFNNNKAKVYVGDIRDEELFNEQTEAGRVAVTLALRHPGRMWGLHDMKKKCLMDYAGKQSLIKKAERLCEKIMLLSQGNRNALLMGTQSFMLKMYTVLMNYHFAEGIYAELNKIKGSQWFAGYLNEEYKDGRKVTSRTIQENEMNEHLLQCVFDQNEGNIDDALKHAAYAEKALPEAPHPYFYLGECSLKSGFYDNAERAFETCVRNQLKYSEYTREIAPVGDYVTNNFYLALSCMKQGKYDKVLKIMTGLIENKFIGKVDHDLICYLYLARCYEHTGQIDKAVDYYRRVLDLDECHESAVKSLVMLLMKLNKYEEAKTKLKRFAELYAGDVKIMPAKDGMLTAVMNRGGKEFTLHSRYKPLREAEDNVMRSGNLDDKIIVQLGIGLGYSVRAVWNNVSKETPVIAVERNVALGNLALLNGLLEGMNAWANLEILTGHVEHQSVLDAVKEMLKKFPEREVVLLKHGPSYKLYPFFYDDLQTIIKEHTEKRENKYVGI